THRRGGWAAVLGLLGAMTLHGLWNGLATYGLPGIAVAYLLVACVLIALVAVVVADRRRVVRLIWRFLPAYQASGVVTEADLRMLSTLRGRRQARLWARRTSGRAGARRMGAHPVAARGAAVRHRGAGGGRGGGGACEGARRGAPRGGGGAPSPFPPRGAGGGPPAGGGAGARGFGLPPPAGPAA